MSFHHVLVSSVTFSKYFSCMSTLIIVKHFPWTYVFFYTYFTDGYTQVQFISTLKPKHVVKSGQICSYDLEDG